MKEIFLTKKEIEILKSCVFMSLREGLYHFSHLQIDASEKDIKIILGKFGMSKKDAENFIKDSI